MKEDQEQPQESRLKIKMPRHRKLPIDLARRDLEEQEDELQELVQTNVADFDDATQLNEYCTKLRSVYKLYKNSSNDFMDRLRSQAPYEAEKIRIKNNKIQEQIEELKKNINAIRKTKELLDLSSWETSSTASANVEEQESFQYYDVEQQMSSMKLSKYVNTGARSKIGDLGSQNRNVLCHTVPGESNVLFKSDGNAMNSLQTSLSALSVNSTSVTTVSCYSKTPILSTWLNPFSAKTSSGMYYDHQLSQGREYNHDYTSKVSYPYQIQSERFSKPQSPTMFNSNPIDYTPNVSYPYQIQSERFSKPQSPKLPNPNPIEYKNLAPHPNVPNPRLSEKMPNLYQSEKCFKIYNQPSMKSCPLIAPKLTQSNPYMHNASLPQVNISGPILPEQSTTNSYHENANFNANPHYGANNAQFAYQSQFNPLETLSNHLLEQELLKKGIQPFDGKAHTFWPWVGKLQNYIRSLNLSPLKTIQLLESYCTGDPQQMIAHVLASNGEITNEHIEEVWKNLVYRFGSTRKIAEELMSKIEEFERIDGPQLGPKLQKLHDICKVVLYNKRSCPELNIMDLSMGQKLVRAKLPDHIQREWAKIGHAYEEANSNNHPPFSMFVEFLGDQARQKSNTTYDIIPKSSTAKKSLKVLQTHATENEEHSTFQHNQSMPAYYKVNNSPKVCALDNKHGHYIHECRIFKKFSQDEKHQAAYDLWLCFRCLGPHFAADCRANVKCNMCSRRHITLMCPSSTQFSQNNQYVSSPNLNYKSKHEGNNARSSHSNSTENNSK